MTSYAKSKKPKSCSVPGYSSGQDGVDFFAWDPARKRPGSSIDQTSSVQTSEPHLISISAGAQSINAPKKSWSISSNLDLTLGQYHILTQSKKKLTKQTCQVDKCICQNANYPWLF